MQSQGVWFHQLAYIKYQWSKKKFVAINLNKLTYILFAQIYKFTLEEKHVFFISLWD